MVRVTVLDDVAVSPAEQLGQRWAYAFPTACRLRDGAILSACRRGKEKHSRDGVFIVQRSDDGGRSWDAPITIHDGMGAQAPESVHAGTIVEAGDGSVIAMFTAVETGHAPEAYIFSETGRHLEQRFLVSRSTDGGRSWTPAAVAALPGTPPLRYINSRPLPLDDGTLLVPVEVTTEARLQAVMVGRFDPAGNRFTAFRTVAADPGGGLSFGDPKLLRRPDGSILMWLWAFVNATEETVAAHICVSRDNGASWSAPAPVPITCQAAALLGLADGRAIVAGNVRTPPEGIQLWGSDSGGADWTDSTPLQMWDARSQRMLGIPVAARAEAARDPSDGSLWASLPGFTFGSPDLVAAEGSVSVLTYYVVRDGFSEVRACRFTAL